MSATAPYREWLRSVANEWLRTVLRSLRQRVANKALPPDPRVKREPFATHSGRHIILETQPIFHSFLTKSGKGGIVSELLGPPTRLLKSLYVIMVSGSLLIAIQQNTSFQLWRPQLNLKRADLGFE